MQTLLEALQTRESKRTVGDYIYFYDMHDSLVAVSKDLVVGKFLLSIGDALTVISSLEIKAALKEDLQTHSADQLINFIAEQATDVMSSPLTQTDKIKANVWTVQRLAKVLTD